MSSLTDCAVSTCPQTAANLSLLAIYDMLEEAVRPSVLLNTGVGTTQADLHLTECSLCLDYSAQHCKLISSEILNVKQQEIL